MAAHLYYGTSDVILNAWSYFLKAVIFIMGLPIKGKVLGINR